MPIVAEDGKFYCPTCGKELPSHACLMIENGEEFCDNCISDPIYNKRMSPSFKFY